MKIIFDFFLLPSRSLHTNAYGNSFVIGNVFKSQFKINQYKVKG